MTIRADYQVIADMVTRSARVLDIGCGEGELLELLSLARETDGRGIELSRQGVNKAIARGLAVIQGDADRDLDNYPDQSFDAVILSQTLQATLRPKEVVENLLRIGKTAIVSIPNFGYWRLRLEFFMKGKMPTSDTLPYSWYDTPNIHFCTIRDFIDMLDALNVEVVQAVALNGKGKPFGVNAPWWFWNWFGEQAIFLIRKK
jgi:methionine biosynthesis protein MetW